MQLKQNTVIIDADVVLRYLLKDDEDLFKQANKIFEEIFAGKKTVYILQSVIAEIVYVLKGVYDVDKKEIAEVLTELLKSKNIKTQDKQTVIDALNLYANKNLDFVDCLICAYGGNYSVLTFDKKLNKCLKEKG
ncbi:type II toxin-antitoxin system VapC family toxin [Persephonella sp.]|uniref:PIN domain-containing protein n=1 Tax=Persephonella sp. TaxID=2060922 RepID=UPI00260C7AE8|nr:type II toxin-antitoxin system VapC family toxin [Persephonella sp.]